MAVKLKTVNVNQILQISLLDVNRPSDIQGGEFPSYTNFVTISLWDISPADPETKTPHWKDQLKPATVVLTKWELSNIMINTLQFSYFSEGGVDWSHSGWFYIPHDWSKLGTWLCQSPKFDILILLTSLHLILVKSVLRIGFYIKALSPKYDFLYSHNISKKLVSGHSC